MIHEGFPPVFSLLTTIINEGQSCVYLYICFIEIKLVFFCKNAILLYFQDDVALVWFST